jgi:hypothetical protein
LKELKELKALKGPFTYIDAKGWGNISKFQKFFKKFSNFILLYHAAELPSSVEDITKRQMRV